jgi:WD40 repeat protein
VWNAANGRLLTVLVGHTDGAWHAAFSSDSQRIVTASGDHTARLRNASNGQVVATLVGHTAAVWQATFSPDGKRVVTASGDHTGRVWNAVSAQLLFKLEGRLKTVRRRRSHPMSSASSQPAKTRQRGCGMRPTADRAAKLEGHDDSLWHAAFLPDGQRIVTTGENDTARVERGKWPTAGYTRKPSES